MDEKTMFHISVGSATNGAHFSTDLDPEDPQWDDKMTVFLARWEQTRLAVEKYNQRRKA